jgi:hypothetical protein
MLNIARSVTISVFAVTLLLGCRQSTETKILGSWNAPGIDASTRITFNADHTFGGIGEGLGGAHPFKGTWQVNGNQLVIQYEGQEAISETIMTLTHDEMTFMDADGNRPFPWKRVR